MIKYIDKSSISCMVRVFDSRRLGCMLFLIPGNNPGSGKTMHAAGSLMHNDGDYVLMLIGTYSMDGL